MRASAGVSALTLAFASPAQAVGPEALDTVLQKPATVSRMVGAELSASQTFHAPTAGIQVSEPSCADFADVGLDQVFNGNPGTLVAYRGQSSQKSASDARYSVKQAVGVFNSPMAAVDPVVALIFMSDCYGHPITVTDGQGVTDTWTFTQESSSDGAAGWSMTNEANDRTCYVEMRARQEVMFQVKVCSPRSGERAAARIADAMEAGV
ncbi:sensor domain-containing protein [Mycobacteroides saopaulense]|uniref:Sensor domain-containing protein n=1 Tax=Mycobacteroides saopaulense TaxID=1578165 RepID=A0A1X0J863_9MYCO|nr:sensor domain-containing protein [Mycobacteroides saopaulense]ORB58462.1 sensor domain-containing protein [Mycobacteroides saopaulense]